MDLEGILLGKLRKTQKEKYHMISLACGIQNSLTAEAESRMGVAGCVCGGAGLAGGELGQYWSKGTKFQLGKVVSAGELLSGTVMRVNNTVLYISHLLRG